MNNSPATIRSQVRVSITTEAKPQPHLLHRVRTAVSDPENGLWLAFTKAGELKQSAATVTERLTPLLSELFPDEELPDLRDVARYLADEYEQIGDAVLVVDETGKAIAKVSEADIYTPTLVPRESGGMAQPGPRMNPALESQLVQWVFNQARDEETLQKLKGRNPTTALVEAEGDVRLDIFSAAGRQRIVAQLSTDLPKLIEGATGSSRSFLDLCPIGPKLEGGVTRDLDGGASVRRKLVDLRGRNVHFSDAINLRSTIISGWVSCIAQRVLQAATKQSGTVEQVLTGRNTGIWLASGNLAVALRAAGCSTRIITLPPGPREYALYIEGTFGTLQLDPDGYWLRSREVHEQWLIDADFDGTISIDLEKVQAFEVEGVEQAVVVDTR